MLWNLFEQKYTKDFFMSPTRDPKEINAKEIPKAFCRSLSSVNLSLR